jgi:ribosomal protein L15E
MATSRKKLSKRKAPWKKAAPKSARHTKLSPARKAQAKRSAKRAGRRYPNLVDNMREAAEQRE